MLTAVSERAPLLRLRVLPVPTWAVSWLVVTMFSASEPATPTPLAPLAPEMAWACSCCCRCRSWCIRDAPWR